MKDITTWTQEPFRELLLVNTAHLKMTGFCFSLYLRQNTTFRFRVAEGSQSWRSDSLTSTHTWAHLALANHKNAGWFNDPKVSLTTL